MSYIHQIELEFCTVSLREDGILENRFLHDIAYEIDENHLVEIAETMNTLARGERRPIISIAGMYGSITTEARKVDINDANSYTLALALVIQELPQRLLANFYFKLKKVDYPVKTFKTEELAVEWLQQQIRANQLVG